MSAFQSRGLPGSRELIFPWSCDSSHLQHLLLRDTRGYLAHSADKSKAERLETSCLGRSQCPGTGRDVCLQIMVFSAPFSQLRQRRWPGRVFTSVSLLRAALCQEFAPRLDDVFAGAVSLQQIKLNCSRFTCSDLGV